MQNPPLMAKLQGREARLPLLPNFVYPLMADFFALCFPPSRDCRTKHPIVPRAACGCQRKTGAIGLVGCASILLKHTQESGVRILETE